MAFGEVDIQLHCLLELLDGSRAPDRDEGGRAPELEPSEVGVIGSWVYGPGRRQGRLLPGAQLEAELFRDRPRDLAVQGQDVRKLAVVVVPPKVTVATRVDQLYGCAYTVSGTHDRALDDPIYTELPRDLREWLAYFLVLHDRGSRDDARTAQPRELGDEGLGHPVGEVLLLGIAREILEREHCD